ILEGPYLIRECLREFHFVAELITVTPKMVEGYAEIGKSCFEQAVKHTAEALIVRTQPNSEEKLRRKYTGTNPPYFTEEAISWIRDRGCNHFLTDLPSLDPEVDGGALSAHKAFWHVNGRVRAEATITEMIYVPGYIPDGLYLLDLHNL